MKITFAAAVPANAKLIAQVCHQDELPATLEPVLAAAAKASRFAGKTGQVFDGFAERGGQVVRVALAGLGAAGADRAASLEKAGAALTAKYLTSGETVLALDLSGSGLGAAEVASVLLGARLRGWRLDTYRTKLKDEQKPSLAEIVVVGAPDGAEAAWATESAVADGVEFTRELVTEPANVIYPESFVARCEARFAGTGLELRVLDETQMQALPSRAAASTM